MLAFVLVFLVSHIVLSVELLQSSQYKRSSGHTLCCGTGSQWSLIKDAQSSLLSLARLFLSHDSIAREAGRSKSVRVTNQQSRRGCPGLGAMSETAVDASVAGFNLESFIKSAVPSCSSFVVEREQVMGFSGAHIADLKLELPSGPRNVFLKVVAAPQDVADSRELKSYKNECQFLSDVRFAPELEKRGIGVAKTLQVAIVPGSYFAILQDSLSVEHMLLAVHPLARTPEVLQWLARFHSAFFGSVPKDHGLFEVGAHVHLDNRANGLKELELLPTSVANFCQAFSAEHPFFAGQDVSEIGTRLHAVSRQVASHLKPCTHNAGHTTIVHGDWKGANYFLKKDGRGVVGFDWQWTGPGIGATDLIYLFCTSVEDSIVDNYMHHLRFYYDHLEINGGKYSFEDFLIDFKVATLDYARWAFSVRLRGDTPEKFRQRQSNIDVNLGYFRRHLPRVQWLLQLVLEFLPEAENGSLFYQA